MQNKLVYLLLVIGLVQLINCTNEMIFDPANEQLPLATTTGANTFGFLLNDQTWLPYSEDKMKNPINVKMGNDSVFMFSLNLISKKIKRDESLKIFLKCNKPGPCMPTSFTFVDNNKQLGCNIYDLNSNNLQFEITYIDFTGQIISGHFQMIGASNSCGNDIINITQGRFDCKFTQ